MSSPERSHKSVLLAVLLSAPFLAVFDGFALNIALPSIQNDLSTSDAGLQLVVAGYGASYAACLLTGGRLGDMYDRGALFVGGLTLFSLASLAGAVAPNQWWLVGARVLQGAAAAVAYPQTLALVRVHFTGRDLRRALTIFGATVGVASLSAQVLSGLLIAVNVGNLGWRSVLLANVPLGLVASSAALLAIPKCPLSSPTPVDARGSVLWATALASLVFPLVVGRQLGWPAWTWLALVVSALALMLLLRQELAIVRLGGSPLVPWDLLRQHTFRVGLGATSLFYSAQVSFFFAMTIYLQEGLRLSALETGLAFAPQALGFMAASLLVRMRHVQRSRQLVIAGAILLVACMLWLAGMAVGRTGRLDPGALTAAMLMTGVGFGLVIPSLLDLTLRAVPTGYAGTGSGVLVTVQQAGGAIGVSLMGIVLFTVRPHAIAVAAALACEAALFASTAMVVGTIEKGSGYGR